jgi:hypothetical protein
MNCWKCHKSISDTPIKLGFRAECSHCGVALHVCVNCRYYSVGKPNDCSVPGTDRITDREAMNFCEEFAPRTTLLEAKDEEAIAKAKRMLGLE